MKKVKLSFGTYNCIPLGLSPEEIERIYQNIYKPFLSTLYSYPSVSLVLHYSGYLLEWFQSKHPELIMLLNEMVARKQVELLGGGFYNPIFPMIPGTDRIGQIELLTTYLRKTFGKRPRGAWITEGVWEPNLPTSIKNSGIDYIYLDERCFSISGLGGNDLYYPVLTEDQGKIITVFPLTSHLSEKIPQLSPEELLERILEVASRKKENLISLIIPGEALYSRKKGDLFEKEWLTKFLEMILENNDQIEMCLPLRYLKEPSRTKQIYFESYTPSVIANGENIGTFKRVLNRYYESKKLYAKMIYTYSLVNQMRGDKYRKKSAREEIWKGQSHYSYWDGESGGIYLNSFRKAAYKSFIESEKLTREKGIFKPSIVLTDYDMDGLAEYLFQGEEINVYLHQYGGTVFEIDYIPKGWNYLDTFSGPSRKKGPNVAPSDNFPGVQQKNAFLDHFFPLAIDPEQFLSGQYQELGDFLGREYRLKGLDKDKNSLVFSREGKINMGSFCHPVELEKHYQFQNNALTLTLRITNLGNKKITCSFAEEVNLSFQGEGPGFYQVLMVDKELRTEIPPNGGGKQTVSELLVDDKRNHIYLSFHTDLPCSFFYTPVIMNVPVGGEEKPEYQGTGFLFRWELNLEREKTWESSVALSFSKKRGKKAPQAF